MSSLNQRPLKFEPLERRTLLAASVVASVVDGTLVVEGTEQADALEVAAARGGAYTLSALNDETTINGQPKVTLDGVTNGVRVQLDPEGTDDERAADEIRLRGHESLEPQPLELATGPGADRVDIVDFGISRLRIDNTSGGDRVVVADSSAASVAIDNRTDTGSAQLLRTDGGLDKATPEIFHELRANNTNLVVEGATVLGNVLVDNTDGGSFRSSNSTFEPSTQEGTNPLYQGVRSQGGSVDFSEVTIAGPLRISGADDVRLAKVEAAGRVHLAGTGTVDLSDARFGFESDDKHIPLRRFGADLVVRTSNVQLRDVDVEDNARLHVTSTDDGSDANSGRVQVTGGHFGADLVVTGRGPTSVSVEKVERKKTLVEAGDADDRSEWMIDGTLRVRTSGAAEVAIDDVSVRRDVRLRIGADAEKPSSVRIANVNIGRNVALLSTGNEKIELAIEKIERAKLAAFGTGGGSDDWTIGGSLIVRARGGGEIALDGVDVRRNVFMQLGQQRDGNDHDDGWSILVASGKIGGLLSVGTGGGDDQITFDDTEIGWATLVRTGGGNDTLRASDTVFGRFALFDGGAGDGDVLDLDDSSARWWWARRWEALK
jgi:hypothetical protein